MVQEILSNGGDIIKYSGDAFLCIFKVSAEVSMQEALHKSIDTAVVIQKNCRNFQTDVGVILNGKLWMEIFRCFCGYKNLSIPNVNNIVKIAISVGEVYFSLIGNEKSSHYVVIGQVNHTALNEFVL